MIHLKRILEQVSKRKSNTPGKPKQLNVLFVGDADTKAAFSYAQDVLRSGVVSGAVSAANVSIEDFPRLLQSAIGKQYDVVCVMFSNVVASRTIRAEEILQQVYTAAKEFDAKLIAISPTSKEYVPYGHVKYANNDDIVKWVTQTQNVSDYTINAYQLTNKKTMFDQDGLLLNREGHEIIARQVLRALNSIDPKIDTKAIEKKKEKKSTAKKSKKVKFAGLSRGNKSQDLIAIQRRLIKLGYEIDPAEIKAGKFGETTENAVKQFQTINDLPVTSKLSEKDVAAIMATSAKSYGTLVYMAKSLVNRPVEEPETAESPEDTETEDAYAAAASVKRHAEIPKSSKEFFNQWKSVALQHQEEYGIPASITLAQAAIESGFGKSGLTTKYNNFFGITGAYNGKSVKLKNKKGQTFTWRVYPTPEESFEDHASLLNRRYKPDVKNADYVEWAKSLTDGGYAESNYGTNLIKFIKQNGLDDYDTGLDIKGSIDTKGSSSSADVEKVLNLPFSYKNISSLSTYPRKGEKLENDKYFIIHHTAGRGSAESVVSILNKRKLGVQWVVDRDGVIYQTLPAGARGAHILTSDLGPNNSNSQGVEVIANNDADVLPVQSAAVLKLVKSLGYSPSQIYGHGEVNPGHKAETEGKTIKQYIQQNYSKA